MNTKKETNTGKTVSQLKCLKERKMLTLTLQVKGLVWPFFSRDRVHIFSGNVGNEIGVMLRGKGPQKPEVPNDIFRIRTLMTYKDLIE